MPSAVGWETNVKQKLGPRVADMGSSMDPARLAESAADLNIRLMKWRAAPSLDVDRLSSTRCLLLGAGIALVADMQTHICLASSVLMELQSASSSHLQSLLGFIACGDE